MSPRTLFILSLIAALCSCMPYAHAEAPGDRPDCESDSACKAAFLQAFQQSGQGNLSEALRLYRAAYELRADPVIFFSIARILHKQNRFADAAAYYKRFIESPVDEPERKKKAQEYLGQIQTSERQLSSVEVSTSSPSPEQVASPHSLASSASTGRPVVRRWWFWTAIGGGVLVFTAIGLGVGLSQRQPSLPIDMNTYEPTF